VQLREQAFVRCANYPRLFLKRLFLFAQHHAKGQVSPMQLLISTVSVSRRHFSIGSRHFNTARQQAVWSPCFVILAGSFEILRWT